MATSHVGFLVSPYQYGIDKNDRTLSGTVRTFSKERDYFAYKSNSRRINKKQVYRKIPQ